MIRTSLRPTAARWSIGCTLLLALAGPALASPLINGRVSGPYGRSLAGAVVVATGDRYQVYRMPVSGGGDYYNFDAVPGTYTLAVVARGLEAPPVTGLVRSSGHEIVQNFDLQIARPFCIVKSAHPIPLTEGIDSASFHDAPEIKLNSGENVVIPDTAAGWDGPTTVSGRFKIKYSDQALHLAADVTFAAPRVNSQTGSGLYNGNALELAFQNDPYAEDRQAYDPMHDWHLIVGLGDTPDWWLAQPIQSRPLVHEQEEPLARHFLIQEKPAKDGETFRLDVPWDIFLQGGASGQPVTAPEDGAGAAMDIVLDAADPTLARDQATRKFELTWSGFADADTNPSSFKPVQFCLPAP